MSNSKIKVLYHKNCPDGFTSAWVAWTVFGDGADYIPVVHSVPVPDDLIDSDVYFVDFVYPKEQMDKIVAENNKVVAIDHHETEKETVESIDDHLYGEDNSAAVLTWQYFYPNKPVPYFLKLIEDMDLWKLELEHTKDFIAFLALQDYEFQNWSKLVEDFEDEDKFGKYIKQGKIVLKHKDYLVERLAAKSQRIKFEGYEVLAANVPILVTDIGSKLYEIKPPFSVVWYRGHGSLKVSMRSNGDVDVGAIASKYGGGGHYGAASFKLPLNAELPWKFIQKNNNE